MINKNKKALLVLLLLALDSMRARPNKAHRPGESVYIGHGSNLHAYLITSTTHTHGIICVYFHGVFQACSILLLQISRYFCVIPSLFTQHALFWTIGLFESKRFHWRYEGMYGFRCFAVYSSCCYSILDVFRVFFIFLDLHYFTALCGRTNKIRAMPL